MEDIINKLVEEEATKEIEQAISNEQNAIPYTSMSKLPSMGTVIPLNLAGETLQAQFKVEEDIPNIDKYLVEKLGYTSVYSLSEGIRAEQADAIALAIRQIEKDKGFILADMAGIGKGRVGASILRYAFTNGYLPIFITEKPNLFTAMYRDISDIGGLQTLPSGKIKLGNPLILNGYKSGGFEVTYDESGKKIRKPKASETGILNKEGVEVIVAPKQDEIKEIIKKAKMPKGFDYLMLTYSQLAGTSGKAKAKWIQDLVSNLDGKAVLVMDECHNASGTTSDVGKSMTELIQMIKGVTFVSATFSKRPDNMYIYALKTDIVDSPLGTKKLIEVIKQGGERLTENLASNLVASQQMIRRERTFENCDVDYQYMSDSEKTELFRKYDATIKLFREIANFFSNKNPMFIRARNSAIMKFAEKQKIEIVTETRPKGTEEAKKWLRRNEGKYRVSSFTAGEIKRNQFNFIETLLFALKADFVANTTLNQLLNNKLENLTVKDKIKFLSNRKPVIAVRNTLEGVYLNLGLEVGDTIDKADFSMYVLSLALDAVNGSITFKEIKEEGKAKEIKDELKILNEDFEDGGVAYEELLKKIESIDLDIPLSPIDYVIDKIEATARPTWDMEHGGGSTYFKVGEVTGRKFTLKKQQDGKYKLDLNTKPKNKSTTFKQFNNGFYDVLLINESGSTGEDAHSSEKFKDQRPRVMIIHQVELDVNTEVQKRGRINRTGMVNYPSYVYAVSRIPSEIRRLLMLVRKLRSLDANTTANQKQSSKLSQIRDSFGNPIEDIINKYGDECLQEFVNIPDNSEYLQYMPSDAQEKLGGMSGSLAIESFVRNLELSLSDEQEYFYNTVNALYIRLTDELKAAGQYDLETSIVDLKASIKTRVQVTKGLNTNPFNTSVYEEDVYALAEDKPYTKEKVEDLVKELAGNKDADESYQDFLTDYKKHFKEVHLIDVVEGVKKPDLTLAKTEEDKKELEAEYDMRLLNALTRAKDEYNAVLSIFYELKYNSKGEVITDSDGLAITGDLTLKPNRAAVIPAVLDDCYETDEDGNPIVPKEFNNGRFVGVKILKTAKEKYSPMNIELVFCQLSGKPKLLLKPTAKGRKVLEWVVVKTKTIDRFRIVLIDNWEVDPNKRTTIRLLTGNILGAYGIAKDIISRNPLEYSPILNFLKFTTVDNTSIRLAIKLNMKKWQPLIPQYVPVEYPLNSKELIQDLKKSTKFIKSVNGAENFIVQSNRGNIEIYVLGGTTRDIKSKTRKYFSKIYEDGEFERLVNEKGFYFRKNHIFYTPVGSNRSTTLKYVGFSCTIEGNEKGLKEIFDYIYEKDSFTIPIRGVESEETIFNKIDIFKPDLPEEEEAEVGTFTYDTLRPYNSVAENISSFSKFEKYVETSPYGTIYLKSKSNARENISYGLVPLEPTLKDMVINTFQLLNDTEKIKFQDEVSKAIAADKSDLEIGILVEKALKQKVVSMKTIFGYEANDLNYIGEVFKKYNKGEIELPKKKEKEERGGEEYKMPERPLNFDTAQEFIIFLKFKINN